VTLLLAIALAATPAPAMTDVLRGVYGVESSFGRDTRDGDLHRPICERSVGGYQVRPIAIRELVRVGRLAPMRGYSLTHCAGIRKWLAVPANNRRAALLYLTLMLERSGGDIETALCRYNAGTDAERGCRYAGQVLAIASGEGP
jgi:hypothetical protein